jgi:hypothetical protein
MIVQLQRGKKETDARASINFILYPMNAIGNPCCACLASWQQEAPTFPLFLHLNTNQGEHEIHIHTSIDKTVFRPVPFRGRLCAARRVALAPASNFVFFSLFCNVTFFQSPSKVNKVCIFFILNSVGKSIYARHGPFKII